MLIKEAFNIVREKVQLQQLMEELKGMQSNTRFDSDTILCKHRRSTHGKTWPNNTSIHNKLLVYHQLQYFSNKAYLAHLSFSLNCNHLKLKICRGKKLSQKERFMGLLF